MGTVESISTNTQVSRVCSKREGFVLLEAVAALMIVSVVGIAVLGMLGGQFHASSQAEATLVADALLRDRLDRLELMSAGELAPISDSLRQGKFSPPYDGYTWSIRVDQIGSVKSIFDASVTVAWRDGSVTAATRVFRPGRQTR